MKLSFGEAVDKINQGKKVCRQGWNGKNMFLFGVAGNCWDFTTDIDGVEGLDTLPFICMKTADGKLVPWLASQSDVLSRDWLVVE